MRTRCFFLRGLVLGGTRKKDEIKRENFARSAASRAGAALSREELEAPNNPALPKDGAATSRKGGATARVQGDGAESSKQGESPAEAS